MTPFLPANQVRAATLKPDPPTSKTSPRATLKAGAFDVTERQSPIQVSAFLGAKPVLGACREEDVLYMRDTRKSYKLILAILS
jgi:hypothetical protein